MTRYEWFHGKPKRGDFIYMPEYGPVRCASDDIGQESWNLRPIEPEGKVQDSKLHNQALTPVEMTEQFLKARAEKAEARVEELEWSEGRGMPDPVRRLLEARKILAAPYGESTPEAARRVVAERDELKKEMSKALEAISVHAKALGYGQFGCPESLAPAIDEVVGALRKQQPPCAYEAEARAVVKATRALNSSDPFFGNVMVDAGKLGDVLLARNALAAKLPKEGS